MVIKKIMLHVFIGEILANMTQVSDVAPGPLVGVGLICLKYFLARWDDRSESYGHDPGVGLKGKKINLCYIS
jgi:hypothetical protein